jgi:peroxiredoxin Q/BCP
MAARKKSAPDPEPARGVPPAEGAPAPAFELPGADGVPVSSRSLGGAPYVLFFYPKADTPG